MSHGRGGGPRTIIKKVIQILGILSVTMMHGGEAGKQIGNTWMKRRDVVFEELPGATINQMVAPMVTSGALGLTEMGEAQDLCIPLQVPLENPLRMVMICVSMKIVIETGSTELCQTFVG